MRYESDAGEDDERRAALKKESQETWRQATALRKKFCTIGVCRGGTSASYQCVCEKSDAHSSTAHLKPAEANILFIFSTDLRAESSDAPWANPPQWPGAPLNPPYS